MAQPTESSTTLNLGVGGDVIRDFLITLPNGTQVKVQGVVITDAQNPLAAQTVKIGGSAKTEDEELARALRTLTREVRRMRMAVEAMADFNADDAELDDDTSEGV